MYRDHLKGAAWFPSYDGCHAEGPVPTLGHPGRPAKPPPSGVPQSPTPPVPPGPRQGQTPTQQDHALLRPLPLPQPLPLAHPHRHLLGAQAAGKPGPPLGASLPGLGGLVPLPLARWGVGVAVRGGHISRHPATARTALTRGKKLFTTKHLFRAMKGEFSHRFWQRSSLGVHRFPVLSLLAYLLAHWVQVGEGSLARGSLYSSESSAARPRGPDALAGAPRPGPVAPKGRRWGFIRGMREVQVLGQYIPLTFTSIPFPKAPA
jgi:hypothetical protein